MNAITDIFASLLGLGVEPKSLTFLQISLRSVIVLAAALAMMRLGHKRSLARKTAFDAVLLVIVAAVLSRAINGSAPFFESIGAGFIILFVHLAVAWAACRWHWVGLVVKGSPEIVVQDGQMVRPAMRRTHISEHDLLEDLHLSARESDLAKIHLARVERSGDISFIPKEKK